MSRQTEWYQQALTPPEIVEVRIRLGVVPSGDHIQVMVEALDPVNGVQFAAWSEPHRPMSQAHSALKDAFDKATTYLDVHVGPFD